MDPSDDENLDTTHLFISNPSFPTTATFDDPPDTSEPFVFSPFDATDEDSFLPLDVYGVSDFTWNFFLGRDTNEYPDVPRLPGTPFPELYPNWWANQGYASTTVPDPLRLINLERNEYEAEPVILAPYSPLIPALLPLPPVDNHEVETLTMATLSPQDLQNLITGVLQGFPHLANPRTGSMQGLKISSPARFSFIDKTYSAYDFLAACELVFAYHNVTGPWDQVHYAQSYLDGAPAAWARSRLDGLTTAERTAYTWQAFKDDVLAIYGDPDRRLKAAFTIRQLKQKTSAAVYSSEFAALSILVEWGDVALRDQYYSGLKTEVQVEIARGAFPATLNELAALAIRIDSRLFESRKGTTTNPFRNRMGQWQPQNQNSRPPPRDPNAMDVDATGPARPRLTDQLREQLRKDGKCFRCRQKGHMSRDCTAFDNRPQGTATTSRNPFRPQNRVAATHRFDPETGLPNPAYVAATRFDPSTGLPNPAYDAPSSSSSSSSSSVPPPSFQ